MSALTRRHYVAIAATLKEVRFNQSPIYDRRLLRLCDDHAKALAQMLGAGNPRFDQLRFLKDCGCETAAEALSRESKRQKAITDWRSQK